MTGALRERDELCRLDALTLRGLLEAGKLSSVELVESCLGRIEEREPLVEAWAFLDPRYARAQAEMRDTERRAGKPCGPLHGVPVGVKDIFDTSDMPTENGTILHAGRRPTVDAVVVSRLRSAGAVILGKTVTTECAVYAPGKTRNPHNPEHTPGGSSSGSAAAVADFMVPLAVGSQTNGSVIRPASFCGVFGFKPSFGLIPRTGVLAQSRILDHVGVFARSLEDLALLGDALVGHHEGDPDSRATARPGLAAELARTFPLTPDLAFVKTAVWDKATSDVANGFAEIVDALAPHLTEFPLPDELTCGHEVHRTILETDLAVAFGREWERGREQLSPQLQGMIERGLEHRAIDYARAQRAVPRLRAAMDPLFERFDAVLTPAAPGEAPHGLASTGSPVFCTLWTLLGLPAVSLPLLAGSSGLPIGVQLVGRYGDDARLLRTARWVVERLAAGDPQ
jgi:Asp-tRNA(Asn)/Glu-tRNA(Gln) amidotransferase A subunit family amidase